MGRGVTPSRTPTPCTPRLELGEKAEDTNRGSDAIEVETTLR